MKYAVNIPSCNKNVSIEILNEGGKTVAVRKATSAHMLRRPPAWSFSKEVLDLLQREAVDEIWVFCEGLVYTCSMKDFLRLSIPTERGFGPQRFLPLRYWEKKYEV